MRSIDPLCGKGVGCRSSRRFRSPFLLVLGSAVLTGSAAAQAQSFVVSTSSDLPANGSRPAIDDADLIAVGAGRGAAPQLTANHWLAQAGFLPSDIDAFARLESFPVGEAGSYVFSLLSNQGGFLDGDILHFTRGGGVEILYGEPLLLAGLGIPSGNIDVDACDLDEDGRPVFSLQSDATGTSLGMVQDGDVLRLEFDGSVTLLHSEQNVQTSFSIATGFADSIGDVQGLVCVNQEIWVTTQAPSSYDGAVLALGGGARIVVEEDELGLDGAELDALSVSRAGDELSCLTVSATEASPGELLRFSFYGPPGEVFLVVRAGAAGWISYPGFSGFGGFYVDPTDPWLSMVLANAASAIIVLDGSGRFEIDYALPTAAVYGPGPGGDGWTFQLLSASGEVSAPLRIERS